MRGGASSKRFFSAPCLVIDGWANRGRGTEEWIVGGERSVGRPVGRANAFFHARVRVN